MTYIAALIAAFAFGFLLGDRRGIRQANEILDANMRELFKTIGDNRPSPIDRDDAEPDRPTVH